MAFKPFKFLGKLVSTIIPGGGVVSQIIGLDKTPKQVESGLSLLDPIAQYNRTMARPRIAIGIVAVYLMGILIQWGQVLFHVHQAWRIVIPEQLSEFAKIVVTVIVGTRGIEKIVDKIFSKKEGKIKKGVR